MDVKKLLKQVSEEPEKHQKAINAFQNTYEALQIGKYSNEVLIDLIQNGLDNIGASFKKTASDQLDKSGITSPLLKANLLKGCDDVLDHFQKSIEGLVESAIAANRKAEFDRITAKQMIVKTACLAGYMDRFISSSAKILRIGCGGAGILTECGKNIDVTWSSITLKPSEDMYYVYFKWPRTGGEATVCAFTEPKGNTDQDFFIFWKSGTFDTIPM